MSEPVELRTERLLLRPFRITDPEDVFAYAKDTEWALYLGWRMPRPYRRRDAEEHVAGRILSAWSTNPSFAIVLDSAAIGSINLNIRENRDVAELGYALARFHWGKWLMTEAARSVIDWGFKHRSLAKVIARAASRGVGGQAVVAHLVAPTTKHVMVCTMPAMLWKSRVTTSPTALRSGALTTSIMS